ncbi:hypothetical protein [Aliamphritea spongicola]|nr:hypothetical protein [Aliamphritea spongicola]
MTAARQELHNSEQQQQLHGADFERLTRAQPAEALRQPLHNLQRQREQLQQILEQQQGLQQQTESQQKNSNSLNS